MKGSAFILMLVALNPLVFGILVGFFFRRRPLPAPALRIAGTLLYFVLTYGLIFAAISSGDFHPDDGQTASGAPP